MRSNFAGRVRNTSLALSAGMMPVFEAVVNSIHAIEERGSEDADSSISVQIFREGQAASGVLQASLKPGPVALGKIRRFEIVDDGIGFNDSNYESFMTLDSDRKLDKGCRGIGRLVWLKAFNDASVTSTFKNAEGNLIRRIFTFTRTAGGSDPKDEEADSSDGLGTKVSLRGFESRYRDASPKTLRGIAENLLQHILWYFIRPGGAPRIEVRDGAETLNLQAVFEDLMHTEAHGGDRDWGREIFSHSCQAQAWICGQSCFGSVREQSYGADTPDREYDRWARQWNKR